MNSPPCSFKRDTGSPAETTFLRSLLFWNLTWTVTLTCFNITFENAGEATGKKNTTRTLRYAFGKKGLVRSCLQLFQDCFKLDFSKKGVQDSGDKVVRESNHCNSTKRFVWFLAFTLGQLRLLWAAHLIKTPPQTPSSVSGLTSLDLKIQPFKVQRSQPWRAPSGTKKFRAIWWWLEWWLDPQLSKKNEVSFWVQYEDMTWENPGTNIYRSCGMSMYVPIYLILGSESEVQIQHLRIFGPMESPGWNPWNRNPFKLAV